MWVTVLASQPSVSIDTETTQRICSPSLPLLAHGVHGLAEDVGIVVEGVALAKILGIGRRVRSTNSRLKLVDLVEPP